MEDSTPFKQKRIALVAHDHKKDDLLRWIDENTDKLRQHKLCGTGTTSTLVRERFGLEIVSFLSGPIGGDQQIGAAIAEGNIDILVFFWDPLEAQPHDPDVRALLRIAVLHDVVVATNSASADYVFTSPLMNKPYERQAVNPSKDLSKRVELLRALADIDEETES